MLEICYELLGRLGTSFNNLKCARSLFHCLYTKKKKSSIGYLITSGGGCHTDTNDTFKFQSFNMLSEFTAESIQCHYFWHSKIMTLLCFFVCKFAKNTKMNVQQ